MRCMSSLTIGPSLAVPQHTPVVRTLHDMSFFTGGCHTDIGCGKYTALWSMPQLGSRDTKDLSYQIWQRKRAALPHRPARPACICKFTPAVGSRMKPSVVPLLHNLPVTVIPHGVTQEEVCPRERVCSRGLGVPQNARVVLFVGEPVQRVISGLCPAAQALSMSGVT